MQELLEVSLAGTVQEPGRCRAGLIVEAQLFEELLGLPIDSHAETLVALVIRGEDFCLLLWMCLDQSELEHFRSLLVT